MINQQIRAVKTSRKMAGAGERLAQATLAELGQHRPYCTCGRLLRAAAHVTTKVEAVGRVLAIDLILTCAACAKGAETDDGGP